MKSLLCASECSQHCPSGARSAHIIVSLPQLFFPIFSQGLFHRFPHCMYSTLFYSVASHPPLSHSQSQTEFGHWRIPLEYVLIYVGWTSPFLRVHKRTLALRWSRFISADLLVIIAYKGILVRLPPTPQPIPIPSQKRFCIPTQPSFSNTFFHYHFHFLNLLYLLSAENWNLFVGINFISDSIWTKPGRHREFLPSQSSSISPCQFHTLATFYLLRDCTFQRGFVLSSVAAATYRAPWSRQFLVLQRHYFLESAIISDYLTVYSVKQ